MKNAIRLLVPAMMAFMLAGEATEVSAVAQNQLTSFPAQSSQDYVPNVFFTGHVPQKPGEGGAMRYCMVVIYRGGETRTSRGSGNIIITEESSHVDVDGYNYNFSTPDWRSQMTKIIEELYRGSTNVLTVHVELQKI